MSNSHSKAGKRGRAISARQAEALINNACEINVHASAVLKQLIQRGEDLDSDEMVMKTLLTECVKRSGKLIDLHNEITGHPV